MNRDNVQKLIDHLEKLPPEQFDMTVWRSNAECGTVACIAGHAVELLHPEPHRVKHKQMRVVASDLLGIPPEDAKQLFVPHMVGDHAGWTTNPFPYLASPQEAATELRAWLAAGGPPPTA